MEAITAYLERELVPIVIATGEKALGVLGVLVLGLAAHVALRVIFRRVERYARLLRGVAGEPSVEHVKQLATVIRLVKNVAIAAMWGVVALAAIQHLGLDITPILASAGILGLAVGFGAQNIVRDLIGGLFAIFENHIRVGDVVQINGVGGVVEEMTYRVVVLRDFSHNVHVFPHGKVETLTNLTKGFSGMVLDVPVAYREDVDRCIAVIRRVGDGLAADPEFAPRILEPLEIVGVEDFADSAVLIRTRFKTKPIEQWGVGREFRRRLKAAFDREGIEIPFPHRTLYIAGGSAPLRLRREEDPADEGNAPK
jgi:small conductance mechanosensitive channel